MTGVQTCALPILAGESFDFRAGETIHTENSYKYTIETFGCMARGAGWATTAVWTDKDGYFSIHVLERKNNDKKVAL